MADNKLTIFLPPKPSADDKKTAVFPRRKARRFGRRRIVPPWEYTNTRTINYETYRLKTLNPEGLGEFPDDGVDYYYNQHNAFNTFFGGGGQQINFWWFGLIHGTQLSGGPGDNVYNFDVDYQITQENVTTTPAPFTTVLTITFTWSWTGTPGADHSGGTTRIITNGSITTPGDFSDMYKISADETHAMTIDAAIPWIATPTITSEGYFELNGSFNVQPVWHAEERVFEYHAIKAVGEPNGEWDEEHPGVTVYGNNVQGEETFYGGDGFTNPVRGRPQPDTWTAEIQDEADEIIVQLEAESHIRNVSESDIDIDFEWL